MIVTLGERGDEAKRGRRRDRCRKTAKREPNRADRRTSADDVRLLRNSYARHDFQFGLPVLQLSLFLSLTLAVPLIVLAIWPARPLSHDDVGS